MSETITARIKVSGENDDREQWLEVTVPRIDRMRVLDVLEYIRDEQGTEVAYEWYCGVKKCGLCAVKVNGSPVLSCWEPATDKMDIEPLDGFPVMRDLVVDRRSHDEARHRLEPIFQAGSPQAFPATLPSGDFHDTATLSGCIECLACNSVCPAWGEEGFAGPAAFVELARVSMDPRDTASDRGAVAAESGGIQACISCGKCTDVCPADIPVLERAIEGLRSRAVSEGRQDIFPPSLSRSARP